MGSLPPPSIENVQKKAQKTTPTLLDSGWTPCPPLLKNVQEEAAFFSDYFPKLITKFQSCTWYSPLTKYQHSALINQLFLQLY